MKTTITVIIILVVLVGAYFLFLSPKQTVAPTDDSQNVTPPPADNTQTPPANTPPASQTPAPITVSIKNFSFASASLNLKKGTKVTWVNNDTVAHTVTSDTGSTLSSGTLSPGQSYSFTFNNAGTFNYHCSIHPMMKGAVVVGI